MERKLLITQGERAACNSPDTVISTILGSCVSCCLWDPVAQAGGMNHMLLTVSVSRNGICDLGGLNAMELLINDILKLGGRRDRLHAKAFGGAKMMAGLGDIGKRNSEFALDFFRKEGIVCEGHSLGGTEARQIMFWPATGRVRMKASQDAPRENLAEVASKPEPGNDMELF
ncbi:chemotaxis protein CheD [Sulfitobacter sp. LCG007]